MDLVINVVLLVLSICMDSFATAITYGIGKIRIKLSNSIVISLIGMSVLGASLLFSSFIESIINPIIAKNIGAGILVTLGLFMVFRNAIKLLFSSFKCKNNFKNKEKLSKISVLDIFLDETKADVDNSNDLSTKEAFFLGAALSADSFATGLSAGLSFSLEQKLISITLTFVLGVISIIGGAKIGKSLARKINSKLDLSFISGLFLVILGITFF